MSESRDRLQIGQFAELVGLSVPQLRRYDRLRLLEPTGRTPAGYRFYTQDETGAARAIALLRSIDMPIADVRRIITGAASGSGRRSSASTGRASRHVSTKLGASSRLSTP